MHVTMVTTHPCQRRSQLCAAVEGTRRAGLDVDLAEIAFPGPTLNMDMLVERDHHVACLLPGRLESMDAREEYLWSLPRRPDCLAADSCNPWTPAVCARHGIPPRLVLQCMPVRAPEREHDVLHL
jgi:hypothetical protein